MPIPFERVLTAIIKTNIILSSLGVWPLSHLLVEVSFATKGHKVNAFLDLGLVTCVMSNLNVNLWGYVNLFQGLKNHNGFSNLIHNKSEG